jgi:hypothetical protein
MRGSAPESEPGSVAGSTLRLRFIKLIRASTNGNRGRSEDDGRSCRLGDRNFSEGETLSLDANLGRVYAGTIQTVTEKPAHDLREVERWRAA